MNLFTQMKQSFLASRAKKDMENSMFNKPNVHIQGVFNIALIDKFKLALEDIFTAAGVKLDETGQLKSAQYMLQPEWCFIADNCLVHASGLLIKTQPGNRIIHYSLRNITNYDKLSARNLYCRLTAHGLNPELIDDE